MRGAGIERDVEDETVFFDAEHEPVRPACRAARRETIGFEQIVDRDLALLLDLARAPDDGSFVKLDVNEPELRCIIHDFSRRDAE